MAISFLLKILLSSFWAVSFSVETVFEPSKMTSSPDFKSTFQSSKVSQSIVNMVYELSKSNSSREIEAGLTKVQTPFLSQVVFSRKDDFGSMFKVSETSTKRVIYYKFGYGGECLSETTLTVGVMEGTCFHDVDRSFILHASG
jgi:hypothetical protein